ncbi:MAG: hypothetical protein JRI68_33270, partial [Deltaproteobacteria bacterium]|nr:hypothetical protein [Deltaproteobacteria bacterium]
MKKITSRAIDFLVRHWPPVVICLLVLGMHFDMLTWAIPATGDHMIHLYKGWHMAEHMLPSGRLTGWSNMAFSGYPAGVYYPILSDLLISAVRYLTLGLLSWERTYALTFLVLLVASPLAVYAITRRATGQTGGMVAAALALGDVGGWPQGGHYSTVHWAVWPFVLGLTLTMFAVRECERVMEKPLAGNRGRFLWLTVLLALAVLAHPMTVFFLGLAGPLFVITFALARWRRIKWQWVVGRAALAASIAIVMTLFWIVPWMTSGSEWTHGWPSVGFGGLWMSLKEMVTSLIHNELFKNFFWVSCVLGLIGLVLGLISRRLWPTFLAVLLIVAFVATGLCYELGDSLLARKVQIERMAAFMKFIWFALAGVAVDRSGHGVIWLLGRLPERLRSGPRFERSLKISSKVAGLVLVAVLVTLGWDDSYGKVAQIGRLGGGIWDNIVDAESWLGQQPRGPLDRVLYQPGKMCVEGNISSKQCDEIYHRHIFASGPLRTGLPKLRFGYEATAIFRNLPLRHRWPADTFLIRRMLTEPEALSNLHVRWIVSMVEWPDRNDLKLEKRFGDVIIYSVKSGKRPPVWLDGPGRLELETFGDERIRVRVEGATEKSWIK